jgi:outer membrane protein assembly factor BamB
LDELGNLYVTVQNFKGQTNRRGVVKIDRNGNIVLEIDGGTTTDFRGVAVRDGIIYVASGSGIRRFRADNGASISPIIASGTSFRDVAFDRQGNLYALLSNEVRRWSTDFSQYSSFSIPNEDPRAIVLDEDDNIYITFEDTKLIRKYSPNGNPIATYYAYSDLSKVGSLIGLDYDPGTQRLFASHTATGGIGQILWIDRNAPSGATMNAFGPNNLSGVRWLAVYPTSEPAAAVLLLAGLGWLVRRVRRRS